MSMKKLDILEHNHILVFSDLDGTLLDHETYSFREAIPAIQALKERDIPLVLCSSKTRAEIEKVRSEIGNDCPFICENGGAVVIPEDYFSFGFPYTRKDSHYYIIELGTPYARLREALRQISSAVSVRLNGFGDMSIEEISHFCGFSKKTAELARQREYDEPFILEDESIIERIQNIAIRMKLHISRGGRFYHLTGNNDKGKAALILIDLYRRKSGVLTIIAAGDSFNDLPLLSVADIPVLVRKPNGGYDPQMKLDNLVYARGSGPAGWNAAISELLVKFNS